MRQYRLCPIGQPEGGSGCHQEYHNANNNGFNGSAVWERLPVLEEK